MHRISCIQTVWLVVLMLTSLTALSEQKKIFDGPNGSEYEVHYIAFNSTFLQPDIARQYELVRSRAMGVVNISIIRIAQDGTRTPVGAVVEVRATNDIQQPRHLSVQQVVEQPAIYYLAQVQFREGEMLTFDVTVYPEGQTKPLKLRFTQSFFNDQVD